MELLCNDGFTRVGKKAWWREIDKGWKFDLDGSGCHHIAETNVDLDGKPSLSKKGHELNTYARILLVCFDTTTAHTIGYEVQAIIFDGCTHQMAKELFADAKISFTRWSGTNSLATAFISFLGRILYVAVFDTLAQPSTE